MDRNQLMTFIGQIVRIAKDQTQAALLLSQLEELLAKDDQKDEEQLALVKGLQNCVSELMTLPKDQPLNEQVLLLAYRRSMERKVWSEKYG
ncbi:MAG: hypothetical protein J6P36_05880 [Lachnospiraceae bacterium]|jgi:hypothetical protein|nr:hypothetical protein [Lachnospiraceae bacterium]MCR5466004.1 hypothetical protein [Lachnospiraceae bacterium]